MPTRENCLADISQAEYENQEAWLMVFAQEQRDLARLRSLIAEYPDETRSILKELSQ